MNRNCSLQNNFNMQPRVQISKKPILLTLLHDTPSTQIQRDRIIDVNMTEKKYDGRVPIYLKTRWKYQ